MLLLVGKLNDCAFLDRKISLDAIRYEINAADIAVSSRTIRRKLPALGIQDRVPMKKNIFKSKATRKTS